MRKQNKIVLWPVYFDSTKTRKKKRRIPKRLAIPSPRLEEIKEASRRAGFRSEVIAEAANPGCPWKKTGLLLIPKKDSKSKILIKIAGKLSEIR